MPGVLLNSAHTWHASNMANSAYLRKKTCVLYPHAQLLSLHTICPYHDAKWALSLVMQLCQNIFSIVPCGKCVYTLQTFKRSFYEKKVKLAFWPYRCHLLNRLPIMSIAAPSIHRLKTETLTLSYDWTYTHHQQINITTIAESSTVFKSDLVLWLKSKSYRGICFFGLFCCTFSILLWRRISERLYKICFVFTHVWKLPVCKVLSFIRRSLWRRFDGPILSLCKSRLGVKHSAAKSVLV